MSAALEILLSRAHKREKRYGPSPKNDYTSGSGKKQKFWQRNKKTNNQNGMSGMHEAELGAVGVGGLAAEKHHHDNKRMSAMRPSDDTAVGSNGYGGPNTKYAEPTVPAQSHGFNDNYTAGPQYTGDNTRDSGLVGAGVDHGRGGYSTGDNTRNSTMAGSGTNQGRTGYHTGAVTDQQTSGVTEMPGSQMGSSGNRTVVHDPNPYAEVHQGGYVHQITESV